jgi:hypothetical protein
MTKDLAERARDHLAADEIEFLRWRAERWMKMHHFPSALRRSPFYCLRHSPAMIAHTFRGANWRQYLVAPARPAAQIA